MESNLSINFLKNEGLQKGFIDKFDTEVDICNPIPNPLQISYLATVTRMGPSIHPSLDLFPRGAGALVVGRDGPVGAARQEQSHHAQARGQPLDGQMQWRLQERDRMSTVCN